MWRIHFLSKDKYKKKDTYLYSYKNYLKQPVVHLTFSLALSFFAEIYTKALLLFPQQWLIPLP